MALMFFSTSLAGLLAMVSLILLEISSKTVEPNMAVSLYITCVAKDAALYSETGGRQNPAGEERPSENACGGVSDGETPLFS